MLRLRLSLPPHRAEEVGEDLGLIEGVSRVSVLPSLEGEAVIVADVANPASEKVVERVGALGVSNHDYVITRLEVVRRTRASTRTYPARPRSAGSSCWGAPARTRARLPATWP